MSPERCSARTTGPVESACAHLWNWFVQKTKKAVRGHHHAGVEQRADGSRHDQHDHHQDRGGDDAVVAVRLDEVVARDVLRIDVVVPEGADEIGAEDRRVLVADGVAGPVHEPRDEIGDEVGPHDAEGDPSANLRPCSRRVATRTATHARAANRKPMLAISSARWPRP